ncbi:META domain-containing protein [Agromyces humatus]|uniref:DUF306 domain-containing protein n=1 Tax=Agromyces humatus TaxID=279573 RepID=A0ABP4X350_9MICO|nr:META domain-containing protein [Agromyces humatus]
MAAISSRSLLAGALLFAATAVLAACVSPGGSAPEPTPTPTPVPQLDAVGAWGGPSMVGAPPALALADDGTVTGTDGCNRLVGSWGDDGETIAFEQVASTRMACEGVDTWLSGVDTATVDGDTMTVFDGGGAEIGTLERSTDIDPSTVPSGDAAAFLGTWGIPSTPREPSITIRADGSAGGMDGCNEFGGEWTIDGDTLVFGDGFSTQVGCDGIDWLAGRATATVSGDTITFFDESGSEIGTLPRTS